MNIFKSLLFFVCFASLQLFADSQPACQPVCNPPPPSRTYPCVCECYCGGFTIGISAANDDFVSSTVNFLTVGYFDDYFTVDVGANYEHLQFGSANGDFCTVKSHLGLRNRLWQNLFVSYGAMGAVAAVNNNFFFGPRPYRVGAFAGLDLQVVRHWMLSFKIYPFEYERIADDKIYRVFQTGTINCSYVF